MADYEFYVNQYGGSMIPEDAFFGVTARAKDALEQIKRIYRVEPGMENGEAMALCAMAEALYAGRKRECGVSAASVGSVTVRYESGDASKLGIARELYRCALRYLNIYRGVSK